MLKRQAVNQASACVRTAHTLHVGFEASCNSQVGRVAQPRTRWVGYTGYSLLARGRWVYRLRLATRISILLILNLHRL